MSYHTRPFDPACDGDKTALIWPGTGQIVLHQGASEIAPLEEWLELGWQQVEGTPPYVGRPPKGPADMLWWER